MMAMQQSSEIRDVFLRLYQVFETGDMPIMREMLSHEDGVLTIGTDPHEWWQGYETIERVYSEQLKELVGAGVKYTSGNLQCFQQGDVGWGADRLGIVLPDGTEIPARITGVFTRDSGTWKIVQFHASVGVTNQDTLGADLPT